MPEFSTQGADRRIVENRIVLEGGAVPLNTSIKLESLLSEIPGNNVTVTTDPNTGKVIEVRIQGLDL